MSEDVQGLLEKIHSEGIVKAQQERDTILNSAREEAEKIIKEAKAKAASFSAKAKADAEADQKKAADAIRQAARDAVIALRADLLAKLKAVTHECIGEAMTPEVMKQIILEMAKTYGQDQNASMELLLPKKEQETAASYLKQELLASLKTKPLIQLTNEFNSGLQIAFKDNDVFFDFSDDALAEVLCKFVGTKLAAVIKG